MRHRPAAWSRSTVPYSVTRLEYCSPPLRALLLDEEADRAKSGGTHYSQVLAGSGRSTGSASVRAGWTVRATPSAEAPLHVSFDIDAVCPTWAPATGTTVAGGLSFREANYVTEAVAETGALGSLDMVEVNPTLGQLHEDAAKTADLGNMLITSMLGDSII